MNSTQHENQIVLERPLSEWPQILNPAPRSFLQKWLIYALSGSRQIVYKKQCSIRDAEVAGSNPVASTLHFQGFRETGTLIFLSSSNFVLTVAVYPLLMDYGIGSVDLIKLNRY